MKKFNWKSQKIWQWHFYVYIGFLILFGLLGFIGCTLESIKSQSSSIMMMLCSFLLLLVFILMWLILQFLNRKLDVRQPTSDPQLLKTYKQHDKNYLWLRVAMFSMIVITWFLWLLGASIKLEKNTLKLVLEWIGFNWFWMSGVISVYFYYHDLKDKQTIASILHFDD